MMLRGCTRSSRSHEKKITEFKHGDHGRSDARRGNSKSGTIQREVAKAFVRVLKENIADIAASSPGGTGSFIYFERPCLDVGARGGCVRSNWTRK